MVIGLHWCLSPSVFGLKEGSLCGLVTFLFQADLLTAENSNILFLQVLKVQTLRRDVLNWVPQEADLEIWILVQVYLGGDTRKHQ